MLKAIIMEGQGLYQEKLRHLIEEDQTIRVVGYATDKDDFLILSERVSPDLLLIDLLALSDKGIEGIKSIKEKCEAIKVILFSSFWNEDYLRQAIKIGIDGCFTTNQPQEKLLAGIKSVANGFKVIDQEIYTVLNQIDIRQPLWREQSLKQNTLTERQVTILELLAKGLKEEAIAVEIGLSVNTIKYHKRQIFSKLNVMCTNEALVKAMQMNLIINRNHQMGYAC